MRRPPVLQPWLRRLPLAVVCALAVSSAWAQRDIRFDAPQVPAGGTLVLAVPDVGERGARSGVFAQIDTASQGALTRAAEVAGFRGRLDSQLDLPGIAGFDRVLLVGAGSGTADARRLEDVGGHIGRFAARSKAPQIDVVWDGAEPGAAAHLAFGAALGQYRFDTYRTTQTPDEAAGTGTLVVRSPEGAAAARRWDGDWKAVADAVRFARDLVTEPANAVYPETFVERTRAAFAGKPNVSIEVLDVPAMERLGMGSILAVGQGSARPPRLMVVRYNGGARGEAPVAFVGKGITFDSGGISIKPSENMWRMKYDMAGAASATGAVLALAGRGAPVNAVAVAALAENMPSGTAVRPGDVIRTAAGRTYEIMSTDAEGRMVLVDALWYVQRQDNPRVIVDIATLTGAIVTALGNDYAGLFTRDETLAAQLAQAGEAAGEPVWRMPMHPGYGKMLESPIADMRNGGGRPGSGTAAHFIGEWIDAGRVWAHVDIAGMAWRDGNELSTVPTGASGYGVRLLDRFVRDNFER
ncbi:leucyl aminopeptidase [Luteimonas deserti]|uniref:Probable cytosol aminopeptidase n=1 Tax=Luteimonas deserti TaxID=2752306 RepID=A0A7Z0U072_9GAMM|nr:leucyl aminopeptidase [Luteimonas deserti]NYZ64162.1 leucyl aminopeptidase [Luteimonas deserti]